MLKKSKPSQSGMATIEVIPVVMMFFVLMDFTFGFFGAIHSGILNSISARNYAFETIRNRTNVNYLRDSGDSDVTFVYSKAGQRFHGVVGEDAKNDNRWIATKRPLKLSEFKVFRNPAGNGTAHNETIGQMVDDKKASTSFAGTGQTDEDRGVSPIWIMTKYGVCINAACKPR